MKVSVFWFRRDLRLEDNTALNEALSGDTNVLPFFIFDENIIDELQSDDPRICFIYYNLKSIDQKLKEHNSSLICLKGKPLDVWKNLIKTYSIENVFVNKDYEPYALKRDSEIQQLLTSHGIDFLSFKDQVIHEESEVLKNDGTPYTVFTPYKNKWLEIYTPKNSESTISFQNFLHELKTFPSIEEIGFRTSSILVRNYNLKKLHNYKDTRDFPALDSTSYLSPHLRFGTISIRQVISQLSASDHVFMSELIWREFFMQILFHFPHVVTQNFRSKYDGIKWLNNDEDYKKWCEGKTGYPLVDAGMRQLNATGYMHNRVRMIAAGFLCKHLLIDWRLGESYFAKKLLDYELSSNNGNWQWAAGTGCDAAPYFRIFNPIAQCKKFDKDNLYIRKWIPELDSNTYPVPMIDHKYARSRALEIYKIGIEK